MPADFPAAHSMDSAWFAVDRDGHVAYFSTGEAGAMPEPGVHGDDAFELLNRIANLAPPSDVVHDPRGYQLPTGRAGGFPLMADVGRTLVFVSALGPIQADIDAGLAAVVPATEGHAVVFERLTAEQIDRLQRSGVLTAHAFYFPRFGEDGRDPARMGLYEYGHLCENWISGPYGRERLPTRPLHVDQLPPGLRNHLKQASLPDLRFADTVYLQPTEYFECVSWEPAWLGLDNVIHPFPGQEEAYRELMGHFREQKHPYRFEEAEE